MSAGPKPALLCGGMSCAASALTVASLLSGRWTPLILEQLHFAGGTLRFNELERRVAGVSQRELGRQLKVLVAHGAVARTVFGKKPPLRVEYALTGAGNRLLDQLAELAQWQVASTTDRMARDGHEPRNGVGLNQELDTALALHDQNPGLTDRVCHVLRSD